MFGHSDTHIGSILGNTIGMNNVSHQSNGCIFVCRQNVQWIEDYNFAFLWMKQNVSECKKRKEF